ncbi:hypothetical protein MXB_3364 [Myxobolus squamalis]|nr:hypothetical protein MXB_3364 [Myxobolus squamalis]
MSGSERLDPTDTTRRQLLDPGPPLQPLIKITLEPSLHKPSAAAWRMASLNPHDFAILCVIKTGYTFLKSLQARATFSERVTANIRQRGRNILS